MSSDPIPSLPRTTVAFGLFLMTILLGIALNCIYFLWYQPSPPVVKSTHKEVIVLAEDNLEKILKDVPENTCLLLAPAVRRLNLRLTNKAKIILKGNGKPGSVVLETLPDTSFTIEDCTGCRLENITIKSDSVGHAALRIVHGAKIEIVQTILEGVAKAVEIMTQSSDIAIGKCAIKGKIVISDSRRLALTENKISWQNSAFAGPLLQISKSQQLSLDNNDLQGRLEMIEVTADSGFQNCVLRNKIIAPQIGLILESCNDFLLTANTIETEKGPGLGIRKSSNIQIGKTKLSNNIKAVQAMAIEISSSKEISLVDNWIGNRDATQDALQSAYALEIRFSSRVSVLHNEITGFVDYQAGTHAIQEVRGGGVLVDNVIEVAIKNNQIKHGLRKGIYFKKQSDGVIGDNQIEDNADSGIEIENSTATVGPNNTVIKNITGIVIKNSSGLIIANLISKNNAEGIVLDNTALKIVKNKIVENGADGISLRGNSTPELEQNELIKNQGYGVAFRQSKIVQWKQNNLFQENQKGDSNK